MKTNLICAIRNILRNKTNSLITFVGLSIAMACCLLIYFFVNQEFSYNSFHKDIDRIYRVNYRGNYMGTIGHDVRLAPELSKIFKEKVPQIEKCTEYRFAFQNVLKHDDVFYDIDVGYTESDFFDIFSFKFLAGSKSEIFNNPDEIVITKDLADKINKVGLPYEELIGQSISFPLDYEDTQFRITGILDNLPKNSSIKFDGVIPGDNGNNFGGCDNDFGYTSIFYLQKANTKRELTETNVKAVFNDYYIDRVERLKKQNILSDTDDALVAYMLPFEEVYMAEDVFSCSEVSSSKTNSVILIIIGILILTIACSNYTILSLGQYLKKITEVGLRKSLGANKANIFTIFFSEGLVLTFASIFAGAVLCLLCIPIFNNLTDYEIFTELINIPKTVIYVLLAFVAIVSLTSIVPVLVFSRVSPNQMANNKLKMGKQSYLSQVFVSLQYSLSIILVIVTIFIIRQSSHLRNKSLGLTTENIIDVEIDRLENDDKVLFGTLLDEHPGIIDRALVSRNFLNGNSNTFVDKGDGERILVNRFKVDQHYIPTLELQLVKGDNFTHSNIKPGDQTMIVNEAFVKQFEIEDNPIGKAYRFGGSSYTIIGVVKDYHYYDAKSKIFPGMHFTRTDWGNGYYQALIRFQPELLPDVIKHVEKSYEKVAKGKNLVYTFWDEELGERYVEEEQWAKIIGYASFIAILISSLGLFGLTILIINQRIKEIGIRKVNGARVADILSSINKSFIIWLFGSMIIACPIAYLLVEKWLVNFPYRVDVSWWVFIVAGLSALCLAVFTVTFQSWRAASKNPVEALRYE